MKPLLFGLILLLIFTACEKDQGNKKAPEIPPLETMFNDFGEMTNITKSLETGKTNWVYSATTLTVWNAIVWSRLALPVAAFKSATSYQPEVINDVTWTWQWKYPIANNDEYTARLTGTLQTASTIKWEMYISKTGDGAFDDFLWFEGTSATDGKDGQWILYCGPGYPEKLLQVDWKIEVEEIAEITYTYQRKLNDSRTSDKFYGSTMTYGLQESGFDVFASISAYDFQTEQTGNTEMEWNRNDYSGHVKAELFFGDEEWHCWDNYGNDVDCSN